MLSTAEMLACLPPGEAVVVSVDAAALRRSGVLDLLAGAKGAEEPDYRAFIQQTGFNYRDHLDTVLLSVGEKETLVLAAGRFDWKALREYAALNRGACRNNLCRLEASRPGSYISFYPLRRQVLALAVGPDPRAALKLRPQSAGPSAPPGAPVWLRAPGSALRRAESLPPGTRLFLKALENAEEITLRVDPDGGRFQLGLEARCRTPEDAVVLHAQLEKVTDVLRKLILRTDHQPNPSDLSGVLTAGRFWRQGRNVLGQWPLERAFLETLAGGSN